MGGFARRILAVFTLLAAGFLPAAPARAAAEAVSFQAADKVTVFATYQGTGDKSKPLVLLFHQAGSNRGEYKTIAPHLVGLGYNTLALDQRSGGSSFGQRNETAARLGGRADFIEALPDLAAALDWAKQSGHNGKIIVWGSSYSASLVFLLAAKDPRVSAVIAFSPGEYFSQSGLVQKAAASVKQPVLVSSASDSGEIREAATILAAVAGPIKVQIKPKNAGHGSSALNGGGAGEIWPQVERFLATLP